MVQCNKVNEVFAIFLGMFTIDVTSRSFSEIRVREVRVVLIRQLTTKHICEAYRKNDLIYYSGNLQEVPIKNHLYG